MRDLIASPYGKICGEAFIDSVESGHVLTLLMDDGRNVTIDKPAEAQRVLHEVFNWRPRNPN